MKKINSHIARTSLFPLLMLISLSLILANAQKSIAAIAIRGTPTTGSATNSNTLTINKPAGVLVGDVMIVNIVKYDNTSTNSQPTLTGWTSITGSILSGSNQRYGGLLYRIVDGTEGGSFTFNIGTSVDYAAGAIVAFSGVDVSGASPFDATPGTISTPAGTASSVAVTSITTITENAAVIMFGMNSNSTARTFNTWSTTSPGALSEIYDYTGATYETVGAAWAIKPTAGSTGASSLTLSGTAYVGGILLALKPDLKPIISSHPSNQTVCEGSSATFSSESTNGVPTPTATWQISTGGSFSNLTIAPPYSVSTSTVSGTTTSTLTINPSSLSFNGYQYRVIFNNASGSAISNPATLTVNQNSVGGSVSGGTSPICLGSNTGTLILSGHTGSVTKWQKKLDAGSWTDIANTNTTYSEVPSAAGTWQYRAEVQNGVCAAVFANPVLIVVNPRPTSVLSGTATVCSGQSATLSVALTGTSPWDLTYTDGTTPVNVTGITSTPYTFNVTPSSTKTYTITALSDSKCTAQAGDMTGQAVITINTSCQVVTLSQPDQLNAVISGSTTITCGNSAQISVSLTGGTAPYTVTYNSVNYSGPSPITFNVSPTISTTYNSSNLTITDSHSCNSSTSGSAIIMVNPIPAPVATDATSVTTSSFSANWNASAGAAGYRLDVSASSDFSSFVSGYDNRDVALVTTYPVTGLASGVTYHYRIRAYSGSCTSDHSNVKSVSTTSQTIGSPNITGAPFSVDCNTSATGSISFTYGTFNPGNIFTAQLSDNTGSFASPTNIGTGISSPITITIPANTPSGSNSYKIRVVSSDPVVTGSVSSTFTIVNNPCPALYRSVQTGDWNVASTWQVSNDGGGSWVAATLSPSSADGSITIRNGHIVTITASVTADQLTVDAGGTLIVGYNPFLNFYYLTLNNGTGTDLTVNGTLQANDFITNTNSGTIVFGNNSHYIHNIFVSKKKSTTQPMSTTEIPTATWDPGSTCEIQSISYFTTASPLTGLNQNFGNFIWNCTDQQGMDFDMKGTLTSVQGDLTVMSSGSGTKLTSHPVGSRATLNIGGDCIINTGSILELGPLQNITVYGTTSLANGEECLVFKSTADGNASFIDNGTINGTGTARVERYIPNDLKWHFLSSPVSNQEIWPEFAPTPAGSPLSFGPQPWNWDFYYWNPNASITSALYWVNLRKTNGEYNSATIDNPGSYAGYGSSTPPTMQTARGYLVAYNTDWNPASGSPEIHNLSGNLNAGNISKAILQGVNTFNLVGNPYPSSIDWKASSGWDRSPLKENASNFGYDYWIWNDNLANYGTFNSADPDGSGTNGVDRYIAPTQAFFVQASDDGNLIMNNSVRVHSSQSWLKDGYFNPGFVKLRLSSTLNAYSDEMIVSFDPSYTGGGTDKWWSFYADAPEIYSVKSGNNYSINRYNTLIDNLTVDISTKIGVAGTFSISAPGISQFTLCGKVMLEDLKTGTITNLKTTPSYEFAGSPDDSKERFRLLLGSPIGINEPVTNTLNIYSSYKTIYIQHETADEPYLVSISNMIGQVLDTRKLTGNSVNRIDLNLVPGVYIVTVVSEGKTLSKKVVIR